MMIYSPADAADHLDRHDRGRGLLAWLGQSRVVSVVAMLALYIVLGRLFETVVASRYAFGSFYVNQRPDAWVEILAVTVSGLVLPTDPKRMSQIFAWLSTVFLLVPAAVLSAYQGSDRYGMLLMFGGVWLVMMLCRTLSESNLLFRNPTPARAYVGIEIMVVLLLAVLAMLALHVGFQLNLSLSSVYDFRQEFNESLYFPLSYLLPFAAGPLAGLIAAASVYRRSYTPLAIIIVASVLFFGFSSHKALLFYPAFALLIYSAIASRAGHLYLIAIFLVLALATFLVVGTAWEDLLGSSFANRLVFIPAQIHYFFFREFGEIGPQFWAESRLGLGLYRSDLPMPSVNYIGMVMTGDPTIGANTGWIANGFLNADVVGIAIYAVILAVTLHIIDRLGDRYGHAFIGAAFVIPIFNFVNSIDLLAGFLTGGLLPLFIVAAVLIRQDRGATEPAR